MKVNRTMDKLEKTRLHAAEKVAALIDDARDAVDVRIPITDCLPIVDAIADYAACAMLQALLKTMKESDNQAND